MLLGIPDGREKQGADKGLWRAVLRLRIPRLSLHGVLVWSRKAWIPFQMLLKESHGTLFLVSHRDISLIGSFKTRELSMNPPLSNLSSCCWGLWGFRRESSLKTHLEESSAKNVPEECVYSSGGRLTVLFPLKMDAHLTWSCNMPAISWANNLYCAARETTWMGFLEGTFTLVTGSGLLLGSHHQHPFLFPWGHHKCRAQGRLLGDFLA